MALTIRTFVFAAHALALAPLSSYAQAPAPTPAPPAPPSLEPPRPLAPTDVPYPAGAPPHTDPVTVTVKLLVDATGAVVQLTPVTPPQPPFDAAVDAAARAFTFEPARADGTPVAVEITFTHTFLPPPPPAPSAPAAPAADAGAPRTSILRGRLVQLGTRAPISNATVTALVGEHLYTADSDERGRFSLPLPPGPAAITVSAPGHLAFLQRESLAERQELAVTYYVERDRYDPYEIIVVGDRRRDEVSRISLRGPEIHQIPGTFGDPFRVVAALPGVAAVASLLPFPVVRGASPGSTGFLLDGTRVPLLYHLLSGPSVIHPAFVDEIQFYPGGAPVPYGNYTGGIVDGRTARARRDERLLDFDANLLQAGGLVRQPIPALGATVTAAARYGYPGLLLSLATDEASLSYWDYQLRVDGGTPRHGFTIFAFGANDTLSTPAAAASPEAPSPPLEPSFVLGFHRLDLRYHRTLGRTALAARAVLGRDQTSSQGVDFSVLVAEPSVHLTWTRDRALTLAAGLEGSLHDIAQGVASDGGANGFAAITGELDRFYAGGAFAEALWRPAPRWLLRPGVRADVHADGETTRTALDPRLTARYALARIDLPDVPPDSDDSAVWLKGSAGIYHQPPRFVLPLPGLDQMPLRFGLLRSYQTSLGAEVPLGHRFQLTAEGFFNLMDPTLFDLSFNAASAVTEANGSLFPEPGMSTSDDDELIERLTRPRRGRSYGLEVLLRRQAKSGVFGWVSYTLSRSEREQDGAWIPYDFDRTHLVNVVAGLPLPRNWDVGLRLAYQSGKPVTTTAGYNEARGAGYVRFDLRVDKRAVWRDWLLDFYIDVTNVALLPEEVSAGTVIRYVLPTLGVRGRF